MIKPYSKRERKRRAALLLTPPIGSRYIASVLLAANLQPTTDRMQACWVALLRCAVLHDVSLGALSTYSRKAIVRAAWRAHLSPLPIDPRRSDYEVDWDAIDNRLDAAEAVALLLPGLTVVQREMVWLYWAEEYTLEEIGRIYKVTRERVRQIAAKGMRRLRDRVLAVAPQMAAQFVAHAVPYKYGGLIDVH